ncbi:hypothetical protein Cs7R123_32110 [Catellatospora sp. TT07R-123]|uniref:ParB/RepB/Spo0J family partition protein n=1 Tax=Catellatospora sp. TT07R-123 TaxID=2733863 RepID=UPI001B0EDBC8|nr:ParB/RepB/Spo0J family partition protein [Catellatospora sp. TT07R-123]GHJ45869.1 hypothetical protein Cs7R123_32110 [Catellatospora sp. TT07R-123]
MTTATLTTDTDAIVGEQPTVPASPAAWLRAADLDPRELLDNPRNLRVSVGDLDDLKASMEVVGVLCPLVVIPAEGRDGVWQIIIGHRRKYAAIALEMAKVPCWIAADEGEAAMIVAQLAENGHRVGLTPTEEAEAYHQLTLLDWTPEQIAKVRAVPTGRIKASLQLRELPEQARAAADRGTLALDDAARLAEFADDPATLARILKSAGTGWGLQHAIANERSKRAYNEARDRAKAELVLAGVKVTARPKAWGYESPAVEASRLVDSEGERLDPEVVKTMPGFAAFVDKNGSAAKTVIYCADPDKYGYTRASHATTSTAGLTPEERERREQAEREHAAYVEGLATAQQVRRDFYRSAYGTARAAKKLFAEALRETVIATASIRFRELDGLYPALGGVDNEVLATAGEDRLRRCLVAQWICAHEHNLGYAGGMQQWALDRNAAAFWLDQLVSDGYVLSEAETTLRQSLRDDTRDDEDQDTAEIPDDDQAEHENVADDGGSDEHGHGDDPAAGDSFEADGLGGRAGDGLDIDIALAALADAEALTV